MPRCRFLTSDINSRIQETTCHSSERDKEYRHQGNAQFKLLGSSNHESSMSTFMTFSTTFATLEPTQLQEQAVELLEIAECGGRGDEDGVEYLANIGEGDWKG